MVGDMSQVTQSNWKAGIRTTILLATLTGILVLLGALVGGPSTAALFLGIGLLINLGSYWFSDKIALKMSRAQPLAEDQEPRLHQIVRELAFSAGIPMPRLYMIPADQPNAFATGRNPKHSAVAVTRGITQLLSEAELRGVLAHELAHVRNRDILTTSIAAAIGGAITWIAYMLVWFGGDDDSPFGLVGALAMLLLAPIAATLIQLGISRQREFSADATGARIAGSSNALADALERLEAGAKAMPMQVPQAAEPLFIVKPFSGGGVAALFSTHPPIEERVRRLRAMAVGA
jgi:heat shock protein HtpX